LRAVVLGGLPRRAWGLRGGNGKTPEGAPRAPPTDENPGGGGAGGGRDQPGGPWPRGPGRSQRGGPWFTRGIPEIFRRRAAAFGPRGTSRIGKPPPGKGKTRGAVPEKRGR